MYYDSIDRMVDTVSYGTAGITVSSGSWTRPGSAASRSSTALRTTYSFTDDGLTKDVTDPKAIVHRTEYDAARRKVTTIANYVNGTPSSDTADDDQTIRYGYTDGLMTTMTADLSTDQVTTYTYGVPRGASFPDSKIASGRLLKTVAYPDTTGAGDDVTTAYNAQGQPVWTKDQAGNEVTKYYDTGGRETSRRVNALAGSFDGYVRRIDTAYLSRGLVDKVTQYDDTIASNARDQVQYAYDGWGNITSFTQDPDSAIGGSGQASYAVSYTWSASTPSTGVNTIRMATQVLPGSFTITNGYGSGGSLADSMSRLDTLTSSVTLATYTYAGSANLVHTVYDEAGVESGVFDASGTTYPDWDNFNRITQNDWLRVGVTDSNSAYYDARIFYDENSNITRVNEPLYVMNTTSKDVFDMVYTNDSLNRLTAADQGHWNGSTITNKTNRELWTLTQTGNWSSYIQDTDASGTINAMVPTDTDDFADVSDARTFNAANEYTGSTRYIGNGSTAVSDDPDLSAPYDAVGNMVDDGARYKYIYDAFGRLVKVTDRAGSPSTITEYRYNGLGFKIGWHYDADADSDTDGSDPWYWTAYNERWQEVATYKNGDSSPKQRIVHNQAGITGRGGSSYIDSVILTDTQSGSWTGNANGTLGVRKYLLQNWRADVVATTIDDGTPYEYVRYSPYGVPTSYPAGDANRNGETTTGDFTDMSTVLSGGSAAVVCHIDLNKDGLYPDTADTDFLNDESTYTTKKGGYNKVGTGAAGPSLRFAYAGYAWDPAIKMYHVRHRVYNPEMGRWLTRDPIGYAGRVNLLVYIEANPLPGVDPLGLISVPCTSGTCGAANYEPPAPTPEACVSETNNFYDCYRCCVSRGGGNGCIGTCMIKLNPGDAHYPLPPGTDGPSSPQQTACEKACNNTPGARGIVTCSGGVAIACVCKVPNGAPPGTGDCIAMHELVNLAMYDCTGVTDGGKPNRRGDRSEVDLACNEALAYEVAAGCLSNTQCAGSQREICMCNAQKTALISESSCRGAFWRAACVSRQPPTSDQVSRRYSECNSTAQSIRIAAEALCPR